MGPKWSRRLFLQRNREKRARVFASGFAIGRVGWRKEGRKQKAKDPQERKREKCNWRYLARLKFPLLWQNLRHRDKLDSLHLGKRGLFSLLPFLFPSFSLLHSFTHSQNLNSLPTFQFKTLHPHASLSLSLSLAKFWPLNHERLLFTLLHCSCHQNTHALALSSNFRLKMKQRKKWDAMKKDNSRQEGRKDKSSQG